MRSSKKERALSPEAKKELKSVFTLYTPVFVAAAVLIVGFSAIGILLDHTKGQEARDSLLYGGSAIIATVALAFCAVGLAAVRRKDRAEREIELAESQKDGMDVVAGLGPEYETILLVDGESDTVSAFKLSPEVPENVRELIGSGSAYSDVFSMLVRQLVPESDLDRVVRAGSLTNIRGKLHGKQSFDVAFRSKREDKIIFMNMKVARISEESDRYVVSFAAKDREIALNVVHSCLDANYTVLVAVDLESGVSRTLYRASHSYYSDSPYCDYVQAVSDYEKIVSPDHREAWRKFTAVETIRSIPVDEDATELVYLTEGESGGWRRCVIRVYERANNVPSIVALTIRVCDNEIAEKEKTAARFERMEGYLAEKDKAIEQAVGKAEKAEK